MADPLDASAVATPVLTTARLKLHPLTAADATEMTAVLFDPALYTFTGGEPPTTEQLEARYRRWGLGPSTPGESWHNWVVRLGDAGPAIGHVQATMTDHGRAADTAWLIGTPWQGHGYAGEAARALVAWLERNGVGAITAHVHPGHVASGRVAAAAGLAATSDVEDGEIVWRRVAGLHT